MAGFFQRLFSPKTGKKDGNFENRRFSGLLPRISSPFTRFAPFLATFLGNSLTF